MPSTKNYGLDMVGDLTYSNTYWEDALCQAQTMTQGNTPADPIDFGPSGKGDL